MFAARARQEAVARNRAGDYTAPPGMAATARASGLCRGDPELNRLAESLVAETGTYAAPMAEMSRKQAHFASANMLRSRDQSGHSIRRG